MNVARSTEDRLADCFASVFPAVAVDELRSASASSVPDWDSIALATLIAAVEEEFGIIFSTDAYPGLNSFDAFRRQIEELP